jgi:hypothetical protein
MGNFCRLKDKFGIIEKGEKMANLETEMKKLYDRRKSALLSEFQSMGTIPSAFALNELARQQILGLSTAKRMDERLKYTKDIYDKRLEDLRRMLNQMQWGDIAGAGGEVLGSLLPYAGGLFKGKTQYTTPHEAWEKSDKSSWFPKGL